MSFSKLSPALKTCCELLQKRKKEATVTSASPCSKTGIATVVDKIEKSSLSINSGPAETEPHVATASPKHEEIEASAQSHDSIQASEKEEFAIALVDPNLLWENFFSGIIDDLADAVEENTEEKKAEFATSVEVGGAVKRGEHRFATVCNFPIRLILTPLRRGRRVATTFASLLEMQFGPLHVAIQVGNVVLEWNDDSLVAPHLCAYEDQVMELDMQPHSKWVEYTEQQHSTIRKATEKMDFLDQIELLYKVSSEKTRLIHALIEVVIRYNKLYYYNVISRNCQHFVRDALEALEVDLPNELPGGLGEYYNALKKGKTPSVPSEFKTHADLDRYVMLMESKSKSVIDDMPQHDLEFLLALYFRFHLESKKSALKRGDGKALKEWQCQEKNCCMAKLDKLIKMESMKIHNFRTIS